MPTHTCSTVTASFVGFVTPIGTFAHYEAVLMRLVHDSVVDWSLQQLLAAAPAVHTLLLLRLAI